MTMIGPRPEVIRMLEDVIRLLQTAGISYTHNGGSSSIYVISGEIEAGIYCFIHGMTGRFDLEVRRGRDLLIGRHFDSAMECVLSVVPFIVESSNRIRWQENGF